jgi:hypothetical protein
LAVENNHPKKTGGGKRCCGILSPFQIVGETEKRQSTKPFTGTRKSSLIFTGPWFEKGDKFSLTLSGISSRLKVKVQKNCHSISDKLINSG